MQIRQTRLANLARHLNEIHYTLQCFRLFFVLVSCFVDLFNDEDSYLPVENKRKSEGKFKRYRWRTNQHMTPSLPLFGGNFPA